MPGYIRPEGLPPAPGRRIAGLPESRILGESDFRLSPLDRRASRKVGVSVLGCEIKEEASAEGRCRGTFASKGTRPQLPADLQTPCFRMGGRSAPSRAAAPDRCPPPADRKRLGEGKRG